MFSFTKKIMIAACMVAFYPGQFYAFGSDSSDESDSVVVRQSMITPVTKPILLEFKSESRPECKLLPKGLLELPDELLQHIFFQLSNAKDVVSFSLAYPRLFFLCREKIVLNRFFQSLRDREQFDLVALTVAFLRNDADFFSGVLSTSPLKMKEWEFLPFSSHSYCWGGFSLSPRIIDELCNGGNIRAIQSKYSLVPKGEYVDQEQVREALDALAESIVRDTFC